MSLVIVNIVASTRIRGSIDIETLSQRLEHTEYNPEIFPGLVYRQTNHEPTIIMFASGKISSHGARSEEQARQAIATTVRRIEGMGCIIGSADIDEIKMENVVGSANLGCKIDLENVVKCLPTAIYKRRRFPGLIFRPFNNSVICLIFSTGKMVVAGGKSVSQVERVFLDTTNIIKSATEM